MQQTRTVLRSPCSTRFTLRERVCAAELGVVGAALRPNVNAASPCSGSCARGRTVTRASREGCAHIRTAHGGAAAGLPIERDAGAYSKRRGDTPGLTHVRFRPPVGTDFTRPIRVARIPSDNARRPVAACVRGYATGLLWTAAREDVARAASPGTVCANRIVD